MKKQLVLLVFSLVVSISLVSCSANDDGPADSDQFLNADVNGVLFNSSNNSAALSFRKDYNSLGTVSLYVRSISDRGEILDFQIDNFTGIGIYRLGDQVYNKNWISYSTHDHDLWAIMPNGAPNDITNFIEITSNSDDRIEGKISCSKLWNEQQSSYAPIEGQFKLNIRL